MSAYDLDDAVSETATSATATARSARLPVLNDSADVARGVAEVAVSDTA